MPVHLHGAYFMSFLLLTGRCCDSETSVILLLLCLICFLQSFGEVNAGYFSKDVLKGGNIGKRVLGVYYLLENIIHCYYCQSEGGEDSSQGGEDSPPSPPLENTLIITP